MVWRQDAQSLESGAGFERIFGGAGIGHGGGLRGFQHRFGDAGIDFFAVHTLRLHWLAAHVRFCAAHWRDGLVLEPGQTGANLPLGGGLRAGDERYLRAGWKRSHGEKRGVQLGRGAGLEEIADWILEERFRAHSATARGRRKRRARDIRRGEKETRGAAQEASGVPGTRKVRSAVY